MAEGQALHAASSKEIKGRLGELRISFDNEQGNAPIGMRQKDYWAIVTLFTEAHLERRVMMGIAKRLSARIEQLERAATKSLPQIVYRGVFDPSEGYACGNMVTHGGSLWHCNKATTTKPGDGDPAWTLAVKRGRDGKPSEQGVSA